MGKLPRRSFLKRVGTGLIAFVPAVQALAERPGLNRSSLTQPLPTDLMLVGLKLKDDITTVIAKLGQAREITTAHGTGHIEWQYQNAILRFDCQTCADPRVSTIYITAPEVGTTSEGIRVGATLKDVQKIFGAALEDYGPNGVGIHVTEMISLSFRHSKGVVTAITLRDDTCGSCQTDTSFQY